MGNARRASAADLTSPPRPLPDTVTRATGADLPEYRREPYDAAGQWLLWRQFRADLLKENPDGYSDEPTDPDRWVIYCRDVTWVLVKIE